MSIQVLPREEKPIGAKYNFNVDDGLSSFQISIPDYMATNPSVNALIAGAVVFSGSRMLLIQRAAHDFGGSMWEIPGGSCDIQDETILHSVQRELWEETGLHLRGVTALVDVVDIRDGIKDNFTWRKITFVVECDELEEFHGNTRYLEDSVQIKIDPEEHQDWGWATEGEVKTEKWPKGQLQFFEEQKKTLLRAFGDRRHK